MGPDELPEAVRQIVFSQGSQVAKDAWAAALAPERRQAIGLLLQRNTVRQIAFLLGIAPSQVEHWRPMDLPPAAPRPRGRHRPHTPPAAPAPPAEPAPEAAATPPQEEAVPPTSSRPAPTPFMEPTQVPETPETPETTEQPKSPAQQVLGDEGPGLTIEGSIDAIITQAATSGVENFQDRAAQIIRALHNLHTDLTTKGEAIKLRQEYDRLVDECWVVLDKLDATADELDRMGFAVKEHRKTQRPKRRTPKP